MKAYAFIYSRTKYDNTGDYRMLSDVSESICPKEVLSVFFLKILSLTNADNDELRIPQWIFVKEKGVVLWGLAGLNEILNQDYSKDESKRLIRNFVGLIVPDYSGQQLPNDMFFFSKVFSSVMQQLYESFTQSHIMDFLVDVNEASSYIYSIPFDHKLNTDYHYCRLLAPGFNAESLVASCLSYPDDISIAINVARRDAVTSTGFNPLLNAVMRDGMDKESEDVSVKHKCKVCRKVVTDLKDGLCKECWEAQHPHCIQCDKETSQLYDGLCQDCWNEQHPHCKNCRKESPDLYEGLCKACYDLQHPHCKKCDTEFNNPTALSSRGLCEKCERKRQLRRWIWIGIVLLSLAFTLVVQIQYKENPNLFRFHLPFMERNSFFAPDNSNAKEQQKQQEKRQIEYLQVPQQEELKGVQTNGHGVKSNIHNDSQMHDIQKQVKGVVPI